MKKIKITLCKVSEYKVKLLLCKVNEYEIKLILCMLAINRENKFTRSVL